VKKGIREVLNYIIADDENFSLQNRLLLSSIFVGILITFIGSIIGPIISLPIHLRLSGYFLFLFLLVFYYFIRVKKIVKPFIVPFILICLAAITMMWIFNGGINGQGSKIALIALILSLIIVTEGKRRLVLFLFSTLILILYLVQLFKPEYITVYSSEKVQWTDSLTTTVYSLIFIYLIIKFLLRYYTLEKTRAEESEKIQIKLNNDKDRFISILGHDLRSPFQALLGLTALLKDNIHKYDIKEVEHQVNLINKAALSNYSLLEDLLLWVRAEKGSIPFNPQQLSLSSICEGVIENLNQNAVVKNLSVNSLIDDKKYVFADIDMLKTILRNLVSNAIKFTNLGGAIRISAEIIDSGIIISVKDTGIGISQADISKMFDISQVYTTKGTHDEKGTGLGLLICKEFVEKHGGKIWADSEYGKGATFRFSLPYIADYERKANDINEGKDDFNANRIRKIKILIVDDNNISKMLISKSLEIISEDILSAENGDESVEICRNNSDLDLILMDINMSGIDGYEAVRQIRRFNKDVIIIAQTATDLSLVREKAISSGFNEFILKPINNDLLFRYINKYFPKSTAANQE